MMGADALAALARMWQTSLQDLAFSRLSTSLSARHRSTAATVACPRVINYYRTRRATSIPLPRCAPRRTYHTYTVWTPEPETWSGHLEESLCAFRSVPQHKHQHCPIQSGPCRRRLARKLSGRQPSASEMLVHLSNHPALAVRGKYHDDFASPLPPHDPAPWLSHVMNLLDTLMLIFCTA
jgi:hypothetical protein